MLYTTFFHLATAQWLASHFGLEPADARAWGNDALLQACKGGHLAIAQWLTAHFGLGPTDARASDNYALRKACEQGHLGVARWLVSHFALGAPALPGGPTRVIEALSALRIVEAAWSEWECEVGANMATWLPEEMWEDVLALVVAPWVSEPTAPLAIVGRWGAKPCPPGK